MAFDTNDAAYQELRARVVASTSLVVPFVGAGLSIYGPPDQRLPLWQELLERLVTEGRRLGLVGDAIIKIHKALDAGHYIEATDRILKALGEPTFRRIVERELDDSNKPIPPAVAELVTIGWSLIVTTNLDRLIARAFLERYGVPPETITSRDTHRLASVLAGTNQKTRMSLAQLHGDIDQYPSWRLTRSHYQQLQQDPGYMLALQHLFLREIFFVGFSLSDDDFDLVLDTVARVYPAGVGKFYALVARSRRNDPTLQRLIRSNGFQPIFYDVESPPHSDDPYGGHRQVFECLADLAQAWSASNAEFNIALKYFPEAEPNVVGRERELHEILEAAQKPLGAVAQIVGLGGVGKTTLVQEAIERFRPMWSEAGYRGAYGCSFYRADIGQFVHDLELLTVGPSNDPLPERVERISTDMSRHRTLLVLDGSEAILNSNQELQSPYINSIIQGVLAGRGSVVATTRVPIRGGVFNHGIELNLDPLDVAATKELLNDLDLNHLGSDVQDRLYQMTGGHPLAVRILGAMLRTVAPQEALSALETASIVALPDEIDPLSENRLSRLLGSYAHLLSAADASFMRTWAVFDAPASYPLVQDVIAHVYPDTDINSDIAGSDLRTLVARLLDLRLLTVGEDGQLSCHPTVREYFGKTSEDASRRAVPVHRRIADHYSRDTLEYPETFDEASPLILAARHIAATGDWSRFDDVFRRRLMRGFRSYLCNNLGAWDEALGLARLANDANFPGHHTREPAYYQNIVARCFKHLGRSSESKAHYVTGLTQAAQTQDPDTAKYLNNFLTLLIWRGELSAAESLVEANVRALEWVDEPWIRRWQVEHGFSTFAYLRLLQGKIDVANELFDYSSRAWDGAEDRRWMYDYYPYHRAELILLQRPADHAGALEAIANLRDVANRQEWPESLCRGHIHAAIVAADAAAMFESDTYLRESHDHLSRARSIPAGLVVPDVEIALLLAQIKVELATRRLAGRGSSLVEFLDRAEALVTLTGLSLAQPEILATRGLSYLENNDLRNSNLLADQAIGIAQSTGHWLAVHSPRSLLNQLLTLLGRPVPEVEIAPLAEPRAFDGRPLDSVQLTSILNTIS